MVSPGCIHGNYRFTAEKTYGIVRFLGVLDILRSHRKNACTRLFLRWPLLFPHFLQEASCMMLRTYIISAFLLSSLLTFTLGAHASTNDEEQIRTMISQMEQAWQEADGKKWASHFSEDADFVVWFGQHFVGRETIGGVLHHILHDFYADTESYAEITKIRFPSSDIAVVHLEFSIYDKGEEIPKRSTTIPMMVLQRTQAGWQIVSFHNTKNLIEERGKSGDARD